MELYKKYRPKLLKEIIGQPSVVKGLTSLLKKNEIPHTILFSGGSGQGKTTLARIIAKHLKCHDNDFFEMDCADFRGIDMVRSIKSRVNQAPISGNCRIWLIDECFTKGTLVKTPNGSKKIEILKTGDTIFSAKGKDKITNTFINKIPLERLVKVSLNNGEILYCSNKHEFYTDKGWKFAKNLTKKDLIFSFVSDIMLENKSKTNEKEYAQRCKKRSPSSIIRVESVEIYKRGSNDQYFKNIIGDKELYNGFIELYDLEVEGHPSYFANNTLVHNCHKMTSDAQNAFLKILEDTPKHVYFFLATTDKRKLLKTIQTRATEFAVKPLNIRGTANLIENICKKENIDVPTQDVVYAIHEASEGSPRKALVLLNQIMSFTTENEMLEAISSASNEEDMIIVPKTLFNYKTTWKDMCSALKKVQDYDAEAIRYLTLAYAKKVLLSGGKSAPVAYNIIVAFSDNFYETKHAGLAAACYEVIQGN